MALLVFFCLRNRISKLRLGRPFISSRSWHWRQTLQTSKRSTAQVSQSPVHPEHLSGHCKTTRVALVSLVVQNDYEWLWCNQYVITLINVYQCWISLLNHVLIIFCWGTGRCGRLLRSNCFLSKIIRPIYNVVFDEWHLGFSISQLTFCEKSLRFTCSHVACSLKKCFKHVKSLPGISMWTLTKIIRRTRRSWNQVWRTFFLRMLLGHKIDVIAVGSIHDAWWICVRHNRHTLHAMTFQFHMFHMCDRVCCFCAGDKVANYDASCHRLVLSSIAGMLNHLRPPTYVLSIEICWDSLAFLHMFHYVSAGFRLFLRTSGIF